MIHQMGCGYVWSKSKIVMEVSGVLSSCKKFSPFVLEVLLDSLQGSEFLFAGERERSFLQESEHGMLALLEERKHVLFTTWSPRT